MIKEFGLVSGGRKGDHQSFLSNFSGCFSKKPFQTANKITDRLLQMGWDYGIDGYRLNDMLRRKVGNCLGLSCLYGSILVENGFSPEYELVVGPKGYQRETEIDLLECLLRGDYFSFDQPVMPEKAEDFQHLEFATLMHPRLKFDGDIFETTTLNYQEPSTIEGESIRILSEDQLLALVLFERGYQERIDLRPDFDRAKKLLLESLKKDPQNRMAWAELAKIAWDSFDDRLFFQARNGFLSAEDNDSQYLLERYWLLGNVEDLDRALFCNSTNMIAWWQKNVALEKDLRTQRVNCAVAAQCVARSGVLDLGNFYSTNAHLLALLFPNDALNLVAGSLSKKTRRFDYQIALAMLGLPEMLDDLSPSSPIELARLAFAQKILRKESNAWMFVSRRFGDSKIFQSVASLLERQWGRANIHCQLQ